MANYDKLIQQVKRAVPTLTIDEAEKELGTTLFLDVREGNETSQGVIPGALLIPRGMVEMSIENAVPDKATRLIVYCAGGFRSAFTVESLQRLGYSNLENLAGGFGAWKNAGKPWIVDNQADKLSGPRYTRHLRIPEIGEAGQRQLFQSKVLMLGAGGLGSPAAMYLAAAGIGKIGIIDADLVDVSNLQRQIIHKTADVGRPKVDSAADFIRNLNPDVEVVSLRMRLDSSNARELLKDWDVVLNGCDNFPTRYLLNDAAFFAGVPVVDGSIFRFEGQVTIYDPRRGGPCYRCLYPEPPPPELAPSCAEAGVLGVLPGIVGCLQAAETIKLLLGIGDSLQGRLLLFDALTMRFRELRLHPDPACPLCGKEPTVTDLIDYEFFCASAAKG